LIAFHINFFLAADLKNGQYLSPFPFGAFSKKTQFLWKSFSSKANFASFLYFFKPTFTYTVGHLRTYLPPYCFIHRYKNPFFKVQCKPMCAEEFLSSYEKIISLAAF
jgi:hypothetical protein